MPALRSAVVLLTLLPLALAAQADGAQDLLQTQAVTHAQPLGQAQPLVHGQPYSTPSAAYRWVEIALEATAREVDRHGARPTLLARTLAIPLTAMYDAWAAYDDRALGTRLGAKLRRPPA